MSEGFHGLAVGKRLDSSTRWPALLAPAIESSLTTVAAYQFRGIGRRRVLPGWAESKEVYSHGSGMTCERHKTAPLPGSAHCEAACMASADGRKYRSRIPWMQVAKGFRKAGLQTETTAWS